MDNPTVLNEVTMTTEDWKNLFKHANELTDEDIANNKKFEMQGYKTVQIRGVPPYAQMKCEAEGLNADEIVINKKLDILFDMLVEVRNKMGMN